MNSEDRARRLAAEDAEVVSTDWGGLTWFASGRLGNSQDMTVGRCRIKPGCGNPLHFHPNCSEVLVVLAGRIAHTLDADGTEVIMVPGDSISIPEGLAHRARNIGECDADLLIAFSSADRQACPVDRK